MSLLGERSLGGVGAETIGAVKRHSEPVPMVWFQHVTIIAPAGFDSRGELQVALLGGSPWLGDASSCGRTDEVSG
eukprot:1683616-Rhodomonas_salina.1